MDATDANNAAADLTDNSSMRFTLADHSQNSITISVAKGAVLILKPDGRLERGEAFAADDAVSVEIFDILSRAMPSWMSALRERAEKAESELAALRDRAETEKGGNLSDETLQSAREA